MKGMKFFVLIVFLVGLPYNIQSAYVAPTSAAWNAVARCFPCLEEEPNHIYELSLFSYANTIYPDAFVYKLQNPPADAPADVEWFEIRAKTESQYRFQSMKIFSGRSVDIIYLSGTMMSIAPYQDKTDFRIMVFQEDEHARNFANDLIKANKYEIDQNIERVPLERIEKNTSLYGDPVPLIYHAVIVTKVLPDNTIRYYFRSESDDKTWAILSAAQFSVNRSTPTEILMKSMVSTIEKETYKLVFNFPETADSFITVAEAYANERKYYSESRQESASGRWDPAAVAERQQRARVKPLCLYDVTDKDEDEEAPLIKKEEYIEEYYGKGKGKAPIEYGPIIEKVNALEVEMTQFTSSSKVFGDDDDDE